MQRKQRAQAKSFTTANPMIYGGVGWQDRRTSSRLQERQAREQNLRVEHAKQSYYSGGSSFSGEDDDEYKEEHHQSNEKIDNSTLMSREGRRLAREHKKAEEQALVLSQELEAKERAERESAKAAEVEAIAAKYAQQQHFAPLKVFLKKPTNLDLDRNHTNSTSEVDIESFSEDDTLAKANKAVHSANNQIDNIGSVDATNDTEMMVDEAEALVHIKDSFTEDDDDPTEQHLQNDQGRLKSKDDNSIVNDVGNEELGETPSSTFMVDEAEALVDLTHAPIINQDQP